MKIRKKFYPTILGKKGDIVEKEPIPSDWHTDIAEVGSVLRAVDLARDNFNIIELGCGWGCWLNIAGKVAKDKGLQVHLYGVEGDPGHVAFADEAMADNGFTREEYTIVNGVAAAQEGFALFPSQIVPGVSWGEEPVFNVSKAKALLYKAKGYVSVPQVTLDKIAGEDTRIDLLHIDIQGGEYDLIKGSMDFLDKNVAMMFVGTHSRTIEGNLIEFLSSRGWVLEVERPAIIGVGMRIKTYVDGCELWRNPRLMSDDQVYDVHGSIKMVKCPEKVSAGERFTVRVNVKNDTHETWNSKGMFPCSMSYHFVDQSGQMAIYDGERTQFSDGALAAKSMSEEEMHVTAPSTPGDYQVVLTVVRDGKFWYEDKKGFKTTSCKVTVV